MIFAVEPLKDCWQEAMTLAEEHWQETESYRHGQKFLPMFERYAPYDDSGWFFVATGRDDGHLVGYAGMYVTPSMHTQQIIATEDTWFLLPEYRKGRNAIEFCKFVEAECRARGAVEICMTAKLGNGAGRILEYLGYDMVSKQYSKSLGSADSAIHQPVTEKSDVLAVTTCNT